MRWTIPNILTLLRIALIPVFMLAYYLPFSWSHLLTTALFGLAAVTDWFDGYLARRLKQASPFGAFLDPVADKLIVAVALIMLVQSNPTLWFVIPAVVIVGREIAISALREWMAELGERTQVAVSTIGKIKTTVQMSALLLLLYHEPLWGLSTQQLGVVLLYIAALLTLWSMVIYLRAALPVLMDSEKT
jgi:CDP-diacylglycerol--glycerol-3-phosphate 3-phosphatidyltransferase/cardiolipin synthase